MGKQALSATDKIIHIVHLSAQDILLYRRNGLSPAARDLIDKHLVVCKDCRARLQLTARLAERYGHPAVSEQAAALWAESKAGNAVKRLIEKLRSVFTAKPVYAFAPVILLVFIALSFLLSLPFLHLPGFEGKEITRYKGLLPYINIYKKAGSTVELLTDFSLVEEKNKVQLSYVACDMKYGMIFSFDGNGNLTMHYPVKYESSLSLALDNQGEIFLPHSFIFDDAPAFERFFFVTAEAEFVPDTVIAAAKALLKTPDKGRTGLLELPPEFRQSAIILLKESK